MGRWTRTLAVGTVALFLAAAGIGCNDNNNNGTPVTFTLNGSGTYSAVTVTIDLSSASASLGSCDLYAGLIARGCSITAQTTDGVLEITISGCDIGASDTLFRCPLLSGNTSDIRRYTDVTGTCAIPGCDETPGIGISTGGATATSTTSTSSTISSTVSTTSTTTTSSTSSTSSTTTSTTTTITSTTTTTTTSGGGGSFDITFRLDDAVSVAALQLSVDYSGASGGFDGSADSVSCTNLTSALFVPNDDESTSTLGLGYIVIGAITGPTDLARCVFTSTSGTPQKSDFVVTVTDADVSPFPGVSISTIVAK